MKEITTRDDIELLVDEFYKKVVEDTHIGSFFTDVVVLDFTVHIPIMYDFWETTLLGVPNYKGNPMVKHIDLHRKKELNATHFKRWLDLWEETVKENFKGTIAENAIVKANQIAALMKFKVSTYHKM